MNYNNIQKILDQNTSFDGRASKIIKLVSDCYGLFDMNQLTQNFYSDNTNFHKIPNKTFKKEFDRYSEERKTATLIPVIHLHSSSSPVSSSIAKSGIFNTSSRTIESLNKSKSEDDVDDLTNTLMTSIGDNENLQNHKEIISLKSKPYNLEKFANSSSKSNSLSNEDSLVYKHRLISKNECLRCRKKFDTASSSNSIEGPLRTYFHQKCFNCYHCNSNLDKNSYFYNQRRLLCSRCIGESLEKCTYCHFVISDRIIRVLGQPYHRKCFTCSICNCSLDSKAFTVDVHERIFCLDDFHKQYAPRCDGCGQIICPQKQDNENKRIISADKTFHLQCFGAHNKT